MASKETQKEDPYEDARGAFKDYDELVNRLIGKYVPEVDRLSIALGDTEHRRWKEKNIFIQNAF